MHILNTMRLPYLFILHIFLILKIVFPGKSVAQPLEHHITQNLQVTAPRGNYKTQNCQ